MVSEEIWPWLLEDIAGEERREYLLALSFSGIDTPRYVKAVCSNGGRWVLALELVFMIKHERLTNLMQIQ